ncbi:MAG: hypothetical protein IJI14_11860 [Anaerolineaceae bacterium]|nr:hypothetical protein [Anaerolineaceae bacterium]
MKRLIFVLLCSFLLALSTAMISSAQELSEEMAKVVSDNLDNFFPISSISEAFETKSPAVRGNIGPETATETSTQNGTRNLLLYSNPDGETEYLLIEKLNAGNLKNFYYEMEINLNDLYPADGGGCFLGYINEFIPGISTEEEVETTSLVISDAIYMEKRIDGSVQGYRTKLADLNTNHIKVTIIRLTGETLFYADGKLIGVNHDGKIGPFQLRYGTLAFPNGEVTDCSFDNLAVRKVMP